MTKHYDLARGATLIEPVMDALMEFLGAANPSFYLLVTSATQVQAAAGTVDDQAAIAIDGRWRWNTSPVTATHPGGAAGTHDIYVTASDNVITPGGAGGASVDTTTYTWSLEIRTSGTPSTALHRKVGEVVWDGSKITAIRQLTGPRRDNAPLNPTAPIAGLTPLRVKGAASQTADLLTIEDSAGAALLTVAPTGAATVSALTGTALNTTQASAQFVLANKLLAADSNPVFRINGAGKLEWGLNGSLTPDVNLYRAGNDILRTDDTFQVFGNFLCTTDFQHNGANAGFFNVTAIQQRKSPTQVAIGSAPAALSGASTISEVIGALSRVIRDLQAYGLHGTNTGTWT